MFAKGALKITERLVQNQIIPESDFEIYAFGFESGFAMVTNVIITAIIGFILGMPLESLLMLAVFIPLRSCAGGIHASNNMKCLVLSSISVFLVLVAARAAQDLFSVIFILAVAIACSAIIFALAPVQDANKPIGKDDARILKRRTIKVLCFEIGLFVVLLSFGLIVASLVMTFTLFLVCLSLGFGVLKNYVQKSP